MVPCCEGSSWMWPRGVDRSLVSSTLLTTSIGTESEYAWAIAVAALSRPGPEISRHTPGRPLIRA